MQLLRGIPGLSLALMHVVDAVQKVVFIMPAEGAEQHAKVQPGIADSLHNFIQHGQQRMRLLVKVIQVPRTDGCCRLSKACAIPGQHSLHQYEIEQKTACHRRWAEHRPIALAACIKQSNKQNHTFWCPDHWHNQL